MPPGIEGTRLQLSGYPSNREADERAIKSLSKNKRMNPRLL